MERQPPFSVWANHELGLIEQRIERDMTVEQYEEFFRQTLHCADVLGRPRAARILVWTADGVKPNARVRRLAIEHLGNDDLAGMALYGAGPIMRTFFRLICIVVGIEKARAFSSRDEAIQWLRELGDHD
jgi:hypothetical protein